jgi:hypothetical protein
MRSSVGEFERYAGVGGALIEEQESGTLERLLSSRLGMSRLLARRWERV